MFYRWPRCPRAVRAQVEAIRQGLVSVLREDLVGVYLHGSLAMGCFNPTQSDIDLLVVASHPSSQSAKREMAKLFLAISSNPCPIECSILMQRDLRSWHHPAPFDFHYSESWRRRFVKGASIANSSGFDPDLAAHLSVTRARGICLLGSPIAVVFPEVPLADYLDSAMADYRWARRRNRTFQPGRRRTARLYFVLNALRVWSLLETGRVQSKAEAARWAQRRLPAELRELARSALLGYRTGQHARFVSANRSLGQFMSFIDSRLCELTARPD